MHCELKHFALIFGRCIVLSFDLRLLITPLVPSNFYVHEFLYQHCDLKWTPLH